MIKFFRKIRKSFLAENKFAKYFIYALGEVVLVVIGILIALQINTNHEQHQTTLKIDQLYAEMGSELDRNIDVIDEVLTYYNWVDSIITLIVNDSLHEVNYNKDPFLFDVLTFYKPFELENDAYDKRLSYTDISTENCDSCYYLSKKLFKLRRVIIWTSNKVRDIILDMIINWAKQYPWFKNLKMGNPTPEMMAFFIDDPSYKNSAVLFRLGASHNLSPLLVHYKNLANRLIKKIKTGAIN